LFSTADIPAAQVAQEYSKTLGVCRGSAVHQSTRDGVAVKGIFEEMTCAEADMILSALT